MSAGITQICVDFGTIQTDTSKYFLGMWPVGINKIQVTW